MVGGETLLITLIKGILGYISQKKTIREYIFHAIKASSGEYRLVYLLI